MGQDFTNAPTLADFQDAQNVYAPNGELIGWDWMLSPYGFFGAMTEFAPIGQSWYHGGSVSMERRFYDGLQFNANYTYSKTIDWIENDLFTSYMNPRRPYNMLDPGSQRVLWFRRLSPWTSSQAPPYFPAPPATLSLHL